MYRAPWLVIWPAMALSLAVLGLTCWATRCATCSIPG